MAVYPKNQIYVVIPISKVKKYIDVALDCSRKSVNGGFLVWNFPVGAAILKKIKVDDSCKLYSHDEILKVMSGKLWARPGDLIEPAIIRKKRNEENS